MADDTVQINIVAKDEAAPVIKQTTMTAAELHAELAKGTPIVANSAVAFSRLTAEQYRNIGATDELTASMARFQTISKNAQDYIETTPEQWQRAAVALNAYDAEQSLAREGTTVLTAAQAGYSAEVAAAGRTLITTRAASEGVRGAMELMTGQIAYARREFTFMGINMLMSMGQMGYLVGAVAAVTAGLGYLAYQALESASAVNKLNTELLSLGQQALADKLVPTLGVLHDAMGLTSKDALELTTALGRIRGVGPEAVIGLGAAFDGLKLNAQGAKPAIEFLTKVLTEQKMSLEELVRVFPNATQEQLIAIRTAQESGDVNKIVLATMMLMNKELTQNVPLQAKVNDEKERYWRLLTSMAGDGDLENDRLIAHNQLLLESTNRLAAYHWAVTQMGKAGATKLIDPEEADKVSAEFEKKLEELNKIVEKEGKDRAAFDHMEWEQKLEEQDKANKEFIKGVEERRRVEHEEWEADLHDGEEHNSRLIRDFDNLHRITEKMHKEALDKQFADDMDYFRSIDRLEREQLRQKAQELNELLGYEQGFVQNVLSGRMGLAGALLNISGQFIQRELAQDFKYLTARLFYSNIELSQMYRNGLGGLLFHSEIEAAKTDATATGVTARVSAEAAGAAESMLGWLTHAIAWITGDAAVAAAGATAESAPYAGPAAPAIGAAVGADTLLLLGSLPALATGTMNVPQDMLAQIHKGEIVVPKPYADEMRNGDGTTIHIHCIDATGVHAFVKQHAGALAKGVSDYQRFNPDSRPRY